MCAETVRIELNIAVLDEVYDAFGKVKDPLARIRARMIDSSHGQRSSNKIDVPFHCTVFAFDLEVRRSKTLSESNPGKKFWSFTYSFGLLRERCPKDVSAGRIDVSSHCLLKLALAFQLLGVDEGAEGYSIDEAATADGVAAACRDSSLLCRRSTNSSSLLPKLSVIEFKVPFQGTLRIERAMTWLSRSIAASDTLRSLAVF